MGSRDVNLENGPLAVAMTEGSLAAGTAFLRQPLTPEAFQIECPNGDYVKYVVEWGLAKQGKTQSPSVGTASTNPFDAFGDLDGAADPYPRAPGFPFVTVRRLTTR